MTFDVITNSPCIFTSEYKVIWKKNPAMNQKSTKAFLPVTQLFLIIKLCFVEFLLLLTLSLLKFCNSSLVTFRIIILLCTVSLQGLLVKYRLEMTNGDNKWAKHFSADERCMYT